uniref:Secreted protein n=1 Tax=Steinernema glaseri TaxID=37863 RepID=A0A1I7YZV8_9BILA
MRTGAKRHIFLASFPRAQAPAPWHRFRWHLVLSHSDHHERTSTIGSFVGSDVRVKCCFLPSRSESAV